MGVKVFHVYCPEIGGRIKYEAEFEDYHIDFLTNELSRWYDNDDNQYQDMSVTVIRQQQPGETRTW